MRGLLLMLFSFSLLSCTNQETGGLGSSFDSNLTLENHSKISADHAVAIDVRDPEEVKRNPAPGSINVPMSRFKGQIQQIVPEKNKLIFLFCEYGSRSVRAAAILKNLGYQNIVDIQSWHKWVKMNKNE